MGVEERRAGERHERLRATAVLVFVGGRHRHLSSATRSPSRATCEPRRGITLIHAVRRKGAAQGGRCLRATLAVARWRFRELR